LVLRCGQHFEHRGNRQSSLTAQIL
jgi:hypothetical protein